MKQQYDESQYTPSEMTDFVLTNNRNQLNCFINSMLQIIWHIKPLKSTIEQYAKVKSQMQTRPENMVMD